MFKRVDHVEIVPLDAERTIRFYTDVLGFSVVSSSEVRMPPLKEVTYLTLGDTMVEVLSVDGPAPDEPGYRVGYRALALEVEDMERAVEHLASRGVSLTGGPVDLGDSYRAEFRDPDGLAIELRQWR